MNYKFESSRDEAYHMIYMQNYKSLSSAIAKANGDPDFVLRDYEKLLDNLARNSIHINAKYVNPVDIKAIYGSID